ncbi:hypothetical protein [Sphingosinicella sp. CPCC 101087]|uniref:hypothetical protein n=1 Tax=Sphingosinicella sp. CPCC 101087 TaxID=2497754 RepID=UPI00101C486F|nr:hypothetical protein [Sphingosinicella sp. CPCC 101087]
MAFELERVLYETEDFLRRNLRSRSAREAQKRRAQRKFREAIRRMRRAGFILVALLLALVLVSIFVVEIGFLTWMVALPTVLLVSLMSLFWPSRRAVQLAAETPVVPLGELAVRAEDGLIDRSKELPGRALPAADAIIARLSELQPHLDTLDPRSTLAGDARRLIGEHLPRLVDSYLELPPSRRGPAAESTSRFTESLDIVGQELDHLIDQCCRDRHLSFETQRRFIETRYREDPHLKGE